MRLTRCTVLASVLLLCACSGPSGSSTPPPARSAPQAAASTHVKTPWDGMLKARDKAKAVQKTVDDYSKRQHASLKKQTQ